MKLNSPFVQLPISFDAQRLADEISALGDVVWRPHPQNFAGNSMLPLVAVDGDAGNESFSGAMLPTPELARCPYMQQVLASFGVTAGRTRLMRLSGGAEVTRHVDQGYYWVDRVRVHVPIVTQPGVRFECGDAAVNMAEGECWIFDTWRLHRVLNEDDRSRIHLVCDTVGGEEFWNLVAAGRPVGGEPAPAGWQAKQIDFQEGATPEIRFEQYNVPAVMSPWELKSRLDFLVGEMKPSPGVATVTRLVDALFRAWRAVWAEHADASQAKPEYQRLLKNFLIKVQPLASVAILRNDVPLQEAITVMIAGAAVAGNETPGLGVAASAIRGDMG